MKHLFTLLLAVISLTTVTAQTTIANGNMENWLLVGDPKEEPINWNSNRTGGGNATLGPQTCFRDTTSHGGNYCARIKSGFYIITVVNGSMTTGKVEAPTTNKADGYIRTIAGDPNYAMTFTGRPDSLVFWYKYTPAGSDYPSVQARLHVGNAYAPETPSNNNHPDSSMNIIARALWQGTNTTVSGWTRVSLPFVYVDGRTPQYILITTTSSGNQTGGSNNSTLYLDDFEAIYNPTIATGSVATGPHYVSGVAGTAITVPYTLSGTFTAGNTVTAQLSDATGSFASPVTIGSAVSTVSGSIAATMPSNTPSGTGYRIRVVSSTPALTAANNGSNITIVAVSNSIAPSTTQVIAANANGSQLTVTETAGATSRQWLYSAVPGFGIPVVPSQTGLTYTPNFATADTYYVSVVSNYPGGVTAVSNEVEVQVVSNNIAPTSPQSILVGVNGTTLTVTETPAGMWREWKYSTTSGSGYQSFVPAITGATTYTPNFNSAGTYYVICYSEIANVFVTSNEVMITVGNATLNTSAVNGSPFEFSPSAPNASVSVPFTTSGTFNIGNVFTAQLSDSLGSFANATNIGTLSAVSSGTISATIPKTTAEGTGYRIRVVSSNPALSGSDNGSDLTVDQFRNSIAPAFTQSIYYNTNGAPITVTASQSSTQEWKYSTTSGSGYQSFGTAQTGATYTPNFSMPDTYYVVAVSKNQYNDEVTSNEAAIEVLNGNTVSVTTVIGAPFETSPSAVAQATVSFTSDVVFGAGNVFTAELSDNAGSFANPVAIGTLSGTTPADITVTVPNNTPGGSAYRIRVVSSNPPVVGTDNGVNLFVIPFEITLTPMDTQYFATNVNGNTLTVISSQTATYLWQKSDISGLGYSNFSPNETTASLTPHFAIPGTWYVICKVKNTVNDQFVSSEVVMIVSDPVGIEEKGQNVISAYFNSSDFMIDLRNSDFVSPSVELTNSIGQVVASKQLNASSLNSVTTSIPSGVYLFKITDGEKTVTGKVRK